MKRFVRIVCLLLVLATVIVIPAFAAEQGSNFFAAHSCYLWDVSDTEFQVWFDVTAVRGMDVLGVSEIIIQRSTNGSDWDDVATYYDIYSYNTGYSSGHVTYSSVTSGYYRAQVTFYAENDTGVGEYTAWTSSFHY